MQPARTLQRGACTLAFTDAMGESEVIGRIYGSVAAGCFTGASRTFRACTPSPWKWSATPTTSRQRRVSPGHRPVQLHEGSLDQHKGHTLAPRMTEGVPRRGMRVREVRARTERDSEGFHSGVLA